MHDEAQALTRYLVELRTPEAGWTDLEQAANRARAASELMRQEGVPVRFVRSVYVPEDETCLFLFEAPSAEAVEETARRSSVAFSRVEPTIALPEAIPNQIRSEGVTT